MDKIKTKLKKGDNVIVVSGKDKGKSGSILSIFPSKNKAIVKGINIVKKHARPTQDNPQGGIMEKEASIHISNIMLVVSGKPTRVGFKSLDNGKKVKFAKTTGEVIN